MEFRSIDGIIQTRAIPLTSGEAIFPRSTPDIMFLNGQPYRTQPNLTPLTAIAIGAALSIVTYTTIIKPNLQINRSAVTAKPVTTNTAANGKQSSASIVQASVAAQSARLQSLLNSFGASQGAPYYVIVKDLKTGATASLNSDTPLNGASLYKLFVTNQLYLMADRGLINLDGSFAGTTFQTCITKMITVSDNPCGQALGDYLGWARQHSSLRQQGYSHTSLTSSPIQTSASDVANLLENLYSHRYLSAGSSQAFLGLLKNQQLNEALPQGLPDHVEFAHKTGDLYGYIHDAGIVFGPKNDYIIVAMSGPWHSKDHANASMTKLSRSIYNELQK